MKNVTILSLFIFIVIVVSCGYPEQPNTDIPTLGTVPQDPVFDKSIGSKADSQTVMTIVYYKTPSGKLEGFPASGFIAEGKYLISAYHPFAKGPGEPVKIMVFYKSKGKWDSTQARFDKNFAYNKFNMKTHVWNKTKFSTDFIVLPLTRKIPSYKLDVHAGDTNKDEIFYVSGPPDVKNNIIDVNSRKVVQLIQKTFFMEPDTSYYLGLVGQTGPGFSGAPVYNSKGKIVAILNGGMTPAELLANYNSKIISESDYMEIAPAVQKGYSLNLCVSMNTIARIYFQIPKN